MILFNNKLEMLNTIMIIIIIVFLLTCLITNYFKSIENFESGAKYGIVTCPPQFTQVPGNTNNIYYNEGNIGIGTDNPAHKLTVYGEGDAVPENNSIAIISDKNPQLMALGNSLTSKPSIYLIYNYSNFDINDITTFKGNQILTDGEYFRIISFNGDRYTRLCINSRNGNVGIGTTSPSGLLHIAKTSIDNTIQDQLILECHNNSPNKGNAILFKYRWDTGKYFHMARIKAISQRNGGALIFETNGSSETTTVEAMRIDDFGNTILAGNLSVNGLTNGMKIGQSWSVWVGGGRDGWIFEPNVHNRIFVKIKFHFYNEYYSMIGRNTPASGPVDLTWENDKEISGTWLPYPYTNQGANNGPKFWFMRMQNLPSYLLRIIVVYYDSVRGNYEDLLYA